MPVSRRLGAIDGALALITVLLVVQIWLLTATLESFLAGHMGAALPGFVTSSILFLGCVVLGVFVQRIDAEERSG